VVAVIGPKTAETAAEFGLRVDVQPGHASIPDLVEALAEYAIELREKLAAMPAKQRRGSKVQGPTALRFRSGSPAGGQRPGRWHLSTGTPAPAAAHARAAPAGGADAGGAGPTGAPALRPGGPHGAAAGAFTAGSGAAHARVAAQGGRGCGGGRR